MHSQPLYEDHQVHSAHSDSSGASDGASAAVMETTATEDHADQGGQQGSLNSGVDVGEQNPIEKFIASSNYSRDDLQLILSAVSLALWVATTLYVAKEA